MLRDHVLKVFAVLLQNSFRLIFCVVTTISFRYRRIPQVYSPISRPSQLFSGTSNDSSSPYLLSCTCWLIPLRLGPPSPSTDQKGDIVFVFPAANACEASVPCSKKPGQAYSHSPGGSRETPLPWLIRAYDPGDICLGLCRQLRGTLLTQKKSGTKRKPEKTDEIEAKRNNILRTPSMPSVSYSSQEPFFASPLPHETRWYTVQHAIRSLKTADVRAAADPATVSTTAELRVVTSVRKHVPYIRFAVSGPRTHDSKRPFKSLLLISSFWARPDGSGAPNWEDCIYLILGH